jgi:outer membrane protein TolC
MTFFPLLILILILIPAAVGLGLRLRLRLGLGVGTALLFAALASSSCAQLPTPPANTNQIDLPTVLRLAGSQNLDVQIARQLLAEAQAKRDSAVEQFFPWISPGFQFRRRDGLGQAVPSGIVSEGHFESYAPGGTLTAQIPLGDAIYNSLAAKQFLRSSGEGLEIQRQDSTVAAAQRYFDLVKARALVGVAEEALKTSRDYQDQLHEAVGAGIAFKGDELRVQTQTERYQIALRQGLEHQRVAAANLSALLRLDPLVELFPRDTGLETFNLVSTNAPLDSLVKQALIARPELKQSQALIMAARDEKNGAVYGPLIPSLNAQMFAGGFGGGPDNAPHKFGSAEEYLVGFGWRIGPGGLFDFGRINASKARFDIAQLKAQKLIDEVTRQVVENQTLLLSLSDQIATVKQNLATATETLRLTRERKQFAVGLVLEDIQAQQELTRARSDYLATIAEFNKAQFALKKAIGSEALLPQTSIDNK